MGQNHGLKWFEIFNDLWTSTETRKNSQQFGIANENTRKLISGSDDRASSRTDQKVSYKLLSDVNQIQKISLNKILKHNKVFHPFGLNNELSFIIRLPDSDKVLDVQSSQT